MSTATSITALMTFGFSPQMTNLWVNGQPEGLFITLGGLTGVPEASPTPFVISGKTATGSGAVQGGTLTLIGGTPTATGTGGTGQLLGGNGGTTSGSGGIARVQGGTGVGASSGGAALLTGGASGAGATGNGASAQVTGGASLATNGAGGAGIITGGAGAGTGAGGVVTVTGGASGDGATGNGGSVTVRGGAALSTNGTGGPALLTGGASGAGATGNGASAQVRGGAALSTNGTGGNVIIIGGAATGSSDNSSITMTPGTGGSGPAGGVISRGALLVMQVTPTAKTVAVTLTAAELLTGIITAAQGGGAAANYQLPTASSFQAALPNSIADDDAFDFFLVNISTNAAEDITITTNTNWTLVGNMTVASNAAATDKSSGMFRAFRTSSGNYTLIRLA